MMCLSNANCVLKHPPDMTCAFAAALCRRGWSLIPTNDLTALRHTGKAPSDGVSEEERLQRRREYKRKWIASYRARKKAERSTV